MPLGPTPRKAGQTPRAPKSHQRPILAGDPPPLTTSLGAVTFEIVISTLFSTTRCSVPISHLAVDPRRELTLCQNKRRSKPVFVGWSQVLAFLVSLCRPTRQEMSLPHSMG